MFRPTAFCRNFTIVRPPRTADLQLSDPEPFPDQGRPLPIFAIPKEFPGIDLNVEGQRLLGMDLAPIVADCPFPRAATPPWRYHADNDWFSWGDVVVLHALIRNFRPARILEVGSGFSSAVILDTVEHYMGSTTHCTFIEPYPDRLRSLLRARRSATLQGDRRPSSYGRPWSVP